MHFPHLHTLICYQLILPVSSSGIITWENKQTNKNLDILWVKPTECCNTSNTDTQLLPQALALVAMTWQQRKNILPEKSPSQNTQMALGHNACRAPEGRASSGSFWLGSLTRAKQLPYVCVSSLQLQQCLPLKLQGFNPFYTHEWVFLHIENIHKFWGLALLNIKES